METICDAECRCIGVVASAADAGTAFVANGRFKRGFGDAGGVGGLAATLDAVDVAERES